MKIKPCHWTLRAISLFLVVNLIATTVPGYVWASTIEVGSQVPKPEPLPQETGPSSITRRPSTGRVAPSVRFSSEPTDAELFTAPVFSQALVPVGKASRD